MNLNARGKTGPIINRLHTTKKKEGERSGSGSPARIKDRIEFLSERISVAFYEKAGLLLLAA